LALAYYLDISTTTILISEINNMIIPKKRREGGTNKSNFRKNMSLVGHLLFKAYLLKHDLNCLFRIYIFLFFLSPLHSIS